MKGQPKGLIAAALANMGERFGFYIMMAILTLFISAKFGLNETTAGYIYSGFYASIYLLALVGGIIADKTRNYKGTIMWGLVVMSLGYLIIAIPTPTPVSSLPLYLTLTCVGLLVIAFGNGLFKGNLQALVGQMYDNKEFSAKRESGFQIFYMFINIGGFFAPFVAIGVRNWWLKVNNFDYNAKLPELCHEYLAKGEHMAGEGLANLTSYANSAYLDGTPVSAAGLHDFCNGYLDVFNRGFHYAFIAAIVMMLVSLVIYLSNKQRFPDPSKKAAAGGAKASAEEITMSAQEIRQRIYALFAVFGVVIFFWVSFHQNGYSLTYFARDYVNLDVININLGFTTIKGAEIFQSVNPFFVVTLTPLIMWFFGWLRKRNIEVSTPMKIAIGMGIAATAYLFLMFFSFALPDKAALAGMKADQVQSILVTPWVMVGLYFILTVAELFISPLGLAFVSKVAPPHMQGLMQGFWLAATAVGNALLFVGGWLYMHTPMWATWCVFVAACGMSMLVMLSMVRWLERVTKLPGVIFLYGRCGLSAAAFFVFSQGGSEGVGARCGSRWYVFPAAPVIRQVCPAVHAPAPVVRCPPPVCLARHALRQYARRLPGYDPYRPERRRDTSLIVRLYCFVRRSVCYLLMKRKKIENFFGFMSFLSIFASGSEIFECNDPSSERTHYRPGHAYVCLAGHQVGTNGRHRAAARGVETDAL